MTLRSLNPEMIRGRLVTRSLGRDLILLDKCTSTNDIATEQARNGALHGLTVVSEEQTRGRGRQQRSWLSPRGGVWMSIVLRPPALFRPLDGLPLVGTLAIARAITSTLNIKALVRWPNDVLANNRKVAGILVESSLKGNFPDFIVLGLGVNANFHTTALGKVATSSTSLLDITGSPVDRELLICAALGETERLYELLCSNREIDVLNLVRRVDWSRGKQVKVELGERTLTGIVDDYENLTSIRIILEGDVTIRVETSAVSSVEYQ
jgi:BirA family biotin operon repressor/biotin-[acetyl-CoA-carboxylase] ligase